MISFMGSPFVSCGWLCAPPAGRSASGVYTLPLRRGRARRGVRGRPGVPSRPVGLHPRCKLLITPVFQDFSGVEIDLHGGCLSCARRAPLRVSKTSTVFFQGVFLRAVCCRGAPAGLGQSSRARMPAPGGSRRYARRPWPRSGRLLRHLCCASSLRRGANAEGAGVKAAAGAEQREAGL